MPKTRPMAIVTAPGKIEFQDRPLPTLERDEVQIKVKAVSICGSDLHIYKGAHPAAPLPVPAGHEIAGEVEKVGADVREVKPGDRVAVEPVITCEQCYFCQRGEYSLCQNISFQYRVGQGGFTPHFIAPEKWVHPLPSGLSYSEGALVEPLSVALHAIKKSNLSVGDSCAIFGAGAIGLLLLMLLKTTGGGDVFMVDIQDYRLRKARELGATAVFNNREGNIVEQIIDRSGGLGVDRTFEAVGINLTLVQALQALKKGGMAILLGLFETPEASIPANIFVQKEITLTGSQGYCWDFQGALKLLADKRVDLKPLITHQLPLGQVQDAFDLLTDPQNEAIKVVVTVDN
ncbi:MAG: alcohol dehydrogenase catalytic domain-containing protein [Anaerolineales bacterium]